MDIEVARGELSTVRVVDPVSLPLGDGQARIAVDRFGFSSNNVTYAVVGELLRYWDFFPAAPADPGDDTAWGRIPVWGFGDVVESLAPELAEGERLFGYYPMSSELVIVPGRAQERTITDIALHRAELPAPTTPTSGVRPIPSTEPTGRSCRCSSTRSSTRRS